MTRSRASAKAAGTRHETSVAAYLADHVDDRIERRRQTGAKDRGDLSGIRHMGGRIVAECKDYGGRVQVGPWLDETDVERGNDDAMAGFVVAKRRGTTDPGKQIVLMTLADLVALLTGTRPGERSGERLEELEANDSEVVPLALTREVDLDVIAHASGVGGSDQGAELAPRAAVEVERRRLPKAHAAIVPEEARNGS
ncbi:hypothetical protein CLV28_0692 [Sediminihabitans luteus]|uniref:Uncharacterized protein n=1 Tax=Sediminihabitans luteus TaxID=1138585 RepID=A0A2M9D047_9CELL|nr:hypothetical protein [Sediminihabitans luteus]PJJ77473.1 hypothetical protein CLV28_0692 [Sediminihabitans luteus]GII98367.1 hypothetical protein Slu03_07450 [Sediminihabitans luteus]